MIVANIKELLKKKKASRNVNFTITLVVDIILAVAMAAGFTYGIFHAVGAGTEEIGEKSKSPYNLF